MTQQPEAGPSLLQSEEQSNTPMGQHAEKPAESTADRESGVGKPVDPGEVAALPESGTRGGSGGKQWERR
jgi:hypothetical protein